MARKSRNVPGVQVVKMPADQQARYENMKTRRTSAWNNTTGNSWGFGSAMDKWAGTFQSPLDALYPKKEPDPEKNPWGY